MLVSFFSYKRLQPECWLFSASLVRAYLCPRLQEQQPWNSGNYALRRMKMSRANSSQRTRRFSWFPPATALPLRGLLMSRLTVLSAPNTSTLKPLESELGNVITPQLKKIAHCTELNRSTLCGNWMVVFTMIQLRAVLWGQRWDTDGRHKPFGEHQGCIARGHSGNLCALYRKHFKQIK